MVLLFRNQLVLDYGATENKEASQTIAVLNEAHKRWCAAKRSGRAADEPWPLANGMFTNIEHTLCS